MQVAAKPSKPISPGAPSGKLSPQCRMLLDYMKAGRTLSTFLAISQLGISSLSSRIAELRAAGYDIKGEPKKDFHGKDYLSYSMAFDASDL